jgi:hypothetical protein
MGHLSTITLAVVVAVVACERSAVGQPRNLCTIRIVLTNEAGVPADVLEHAQNRAERIYGPMAIALTWIDPVTTAGAFGSPEGALRLTMKIVPHSKLGYADDVMGFAVKGGNLAYVFHDRVSDFAEQRKIEPATVLAHVLAHEMGHLLLQNRVHPSNGIMRGNWDRAHDLAILRSTSGLSFRIVEAELIRQRIENALACKTSFRIDAKSLSRRRQPLELVGPVEHDSDLIESGRIQRRRDILNHQDALTIGRDVEVSKVEVAKAPRDEGLWLPGREGGLGFDWDNRYRIGGLVEQLMSVRSPDRR